MTRFSSQKSIFSTPMGLPMGSAHPTTREDQDFGGLNIFIGKVNPEVNRFMGDCTGLTEQVTA